MKKAQCCHRSLFACVFFIPGVLLLQGCGAILYRLSSPLPDATIPNPVVINAQAPEFLWAQVVDTTDDYFHVIREQPLQASRDSFLEGRLDTAYRTGASMLEPWRKDSTKGFERLQSTLQSIRRRATIIVQPVSGGFSVFVKVDKELEDVDREQFASESAASFRHDGTVVRTQELVADEPTTLGWISLGRDTSLEQQILQQIVDRMSKRDEQSLLHH